MTAEYLFKLRRNTTMDGDLQLARLELETFLGLTQFYGRLIPNFAELCKPLNELRSKDSQFEMSLSAINAFENIKTAFSSKP